MSNIFAGLAQGFDRGMRGYAQAVRENDMYNRQQQQRAAEIAQQNAFRQQQLDMMQQRYDAEQQQRERQNAIQDNILKARGLLNSGLLSGDIGPNGRTPEEMRAKYDGFNPLPYLTQEDLHYRTPEQKMQDALGLYGAQKGIDAMFSRPQLTGDAGTLAQVLGRTPTMDELMQYKQAGATRLNVGLNREKSFEKGVGESLAAEYMDVRNAAASANDILYNIQAAESILGQGLKTNVLAPAKTRIAAIAQGFGVDPGRLGLESADTAEAFEGIVMKNLLQELMQQKGPQTEGDAERAMKTFARLSNTPEANKFLLRYGKALALRKQEMADFIDDKVGVSGGATEYKAARQEWNRRIANRPLFAMDPKRGLPITYYEFSDAARSLGASADDVDLQWVRLVHDSNKAGAR